MSAVARVVVTGGGQPPPVEAAALAVALSMILTPPPAGPVAVSPAAPAWTRAALREGTGAARHAGAHGLAIVGRDE